MNMLRYLAALVGLAIAAPAMAAFTVATDYTPTGGPVAAGTAGSQIQSSGYYDVVGNTWSIDSNNRVVPSGQPASASGDYFGKKYVLARTSDTTSANEQIAAKIYVTNTSGSNFGLLVHYTAGAAAPNGYGCTLNSSNGIYIVKEVNGTETALANTSLSALTVNQNYTLTCTVTGDGSTTSSIKAVLTNSGGTVLATSTYTDTTASAAQSAGTYAIWQYLPTAGASYYQPAAELITYTYVPPVTLALSGLSAGAYDPLVWDKLLAANSDYGVTADTIETTNNGASLRFNTGATTTIGLSLDTSIWSSFGSTYYVQWSIDNGPLQSAQLSSISGNPSAYTYTLASGLTNGTHTVEFYVIGANTSNSARYSTTAGTAPKNMIRINGVVVDQGGSLAAFSGYNLPSCTSVVYGDSIDEGAYGNPGFLNGVSFTENGNSAKAADWGPFSFAGPLAAGLGCDLAQIGYSGTGYDWVPTYSGAVALKTSYGTFSAGRPRSLPAYAPVASIFNVLGTNDALNGVSMSTVQSDLVNTILPGERALYGTTPWIFVVSPPGGNTLSGGSALPSTLVAAVNAYKSASGDTKIAVIDVSDRIPTRGLGGKGASQQALIEGLHPQVQTGAAYGAAVAVKAAAAMLPSTSPRYSNGFHN